MCGRGRRKRFKDKNGKDVDDGFDKWGGYMAAKQAKLIDQFHNDNIEKVSDIFSSVRILVNGLTHPPAAELKKLMAAHGGEYHMYQASSTTHIIASNLPNVKIKHLGAVPIVKPAWITESIALNKLLDYKRYLLYTNQSRLQPALNFPVVTKPSTSEPNKEVDNEPAEGVTLTVDYVEHSEDDIRSDISEVCELNPTHNSTNNEGTRPGSDESCTNLVDSKNNLPRPNKTSIPESIPHCISSTTRSTKTASDPRFLEEFYSNSRLHLISTLGAEFKQLVGQLRERSDGKFPGREQLITQKGKYNANNPVRSSVVMHIDMDCFFVSVGLRNLPELRGQPVAITHAKSGFLNTNDPNRQAIRDQEFALYEERLPEGAASRVVDIKEKIDGLASMSEIASCSYEARKYGIKNGMFMGQAIKLCPELKTLPYDFEGYKEVSNALYNTVASYTLDIEAVSCDEMYVDIKQILIDTGLTVEEWASHIRNEIMTGTGCPCSTGFGANRLQARLATRKAKPAGQYYLKPQEVETYMSEIPLADVPGVGRATLTKLRNLGYDTCGDLQSGSLKVVQSELGIKLGERIWEQAHGKDNKPLDFYHERKSVSAEINYGIRFKTKDECYNFLRSLAQEVFSRLSDINMKARGLTLKLLVRAEGAPVETAKFLGHGVCDAISKSSTSNQIFCNAEIIYKEAKSIYDKLNNVHFSELRGVGIQLTKLESNAPANTALSYFLKQGVVKKNVSNTINQTESVIAKDDTNADTVGNKGIIQSKCDETPEQSTDVYNKQTKTVREPSSITNSTKSVIRNVFPSAKSRGGGTTGRRGKSPVSHRTMQTFLERPRSDKVAGTGLDENNESQAALLKLRDQIDIDVLNELPEDIRNEIMKEYRFDLKQPTNPISQKPYSATLVQAHPSQNKTALSQIKGTRAITPVTKRSPFANQSWEQVKQGIKIWIRSESEPASVDVELLADHLRQMALDRRIEVLKCGFNFLHRTFTDLGCAWHQAYFCFVNAVQQGMVARYGRILNIVTNFACCRIDL